MKRVWLLLGIPCICSSWILPTYRVDIWRGQKNDQLVKASGYAYYFCDGRGKKCYVVHLTEQDYKDLLRIIETYRGKMVEDTIDIVKRESDLAANVLRDFKQYRRINTIDEVLAVLRR